MDQKKLLEYHRKHLYTTAGIDFKHIKPHIENHKKLDDLLPPNPRFYLVANLNTYQYEFVGKGQFCLSGYPNELVKEKGIEFQLANLHPDDAKFVVDCYAKFRTFLKEHPQEEIKNILIQNNYRFRHKDGHYIHITEQHGVLEYDEYNNPYLILTHVYQVPMVEPFKISCLIKKLLPNQTYETLLSETFPDEKEILSKREKEIVKLIAEGKSSRLIAEILNISFHTVKTHRRNIMNRTGFKSTSELIIYALSKGIL